VNQSFKAVAYPAAIAASVVLFAIMPPWRQGDASAAAAAAQSTLAPSTVSVGGVTLRSVNVDIPNRDRQFEGPGADVVNDNCLTCHSAGMVLTQPRLPRADWQAEVEKMRNTYKGPIDAKDVPAIVDYLANLPH
jgi:cytochrome c5